MLLYKLFICVVGDLGFGCHECPACSCAQPSPPLTLDGQLLVVMFWKLFNRGAEENKGDETGTPPETATAAPSQAAQERSQSLRQAEKEDESDSVDMSRVAQFTFGGTVPVGQDVMLGDCSTTSTDVLKPCEWRVGPSESKSIPKYRIFF